MIFFKSEMSEKDFGEQKQMPQVANTLTKDVLLSVIGKSNNIFKNFLKIKKFVTFVYGNYNKIIIFWGNNTE
jgi:hypothetical protein